MKRRRGVQLDPGSDAGAGAREVQVLLGQPLDGGAGGDAHRLRLPRPGAVGAVELRCGGRGEERPRRPARLHVEGEPVSAHEPARRMQDVDVAGAVSGIERGLHQNRPVVAVAGQDGTGAAPLECERQRALPRLHAGSSVSSTGGGASRWSIHAAMARRGSSPVRMAWP